VSAVTREQAPSRSARGWIGLARGIGIVFGVVAILLLAVVITGLVLRAVPASGGSTHAGILIESVDAGVQHERINGVVARIDGKPVAITTLSNLRALRTAGANRVHLVPSAVSTEPGQGAPLEVAVDGCMVRSDAIDRWIEGSPAGKGEDAWAAVGRGSVVDLAWWPLPDDARLAAVELGAAPADGAELHALSSMGTAVAARVRSLAPQPAAIAMLASSGSPIAEPGTPWLDGDGAVAALTVPSPGIEERTRRGFASPATWSDQHVIPLEGLRRLVDPMSTSCKPLARVVEAVEARATQPAAAERSARAQWLIAASAAEGFAALAATSDRVATLPAVATTLELVPRPVDGEARVIVWPELSDMIDVEVVSTDPEIRLVPVPGVMGRMLEVRDRGGQPAVLPAGRPVSISVTMSLMGKPIGGAVRALLLGREADAAASQRRIPGGAPPSTAPPSTAPPSTAPPSTAPPAVTPPSPDVPSPTVPPAPSPAPAPAPAAAPAPGPAPSSASGAPATTPPPPASQPSPPADPGSTP
jgi:hypothetical protein